MLLGMDDEGRPRTSHASLTIAGTEGMVVSYAKCCHPIPGDDIMGYLSSGRGVVIHQNTCGNLSNFRKQPEKWISVSWEKDIDRDFNSQIQVETLNKSGSNIEQVEVIGRHDDCSILSFLIKVKDRKHLARILRDVRNMQNVVRVARDCA